MCIHERQKNKKRKMGRREKKKRSEMKCVCAKFWILFFLFFFSKIWRRVINVNPLFGFEHVKVRRVGRIVGIAIVANLFGDGRFNLRAFVPLVVRSNRNERRRDFQCSFPHPVVILSFFSAAFVPRIPRSNASVFIARSCEKKKRLVSDASNTLQARKKRRGIGVDTNRRNK
jgi:hypothetical protein